MHCLTNKLRDILPAGCKLVVAPIAKLPPSIFPGEESIISAAVAKRRFEFLAGRLVARQALAELGCAPCPIPAHDEGDPVWPIGFVGSITHTDDVAAAVVAPSARLGGIGLDVESDDALDEDLVSLICLPQEMPQDSSLEARGIDSAKLRFVAKEAFFKALFPTVRRFIDFTDVHVLFDAGDDHFRVVVVNAELAAGLLPRCKVIGRFAHADGMVAAVAYFCQ